MTDFMPFADGLHFLRPWWLLGIVPALVMAIVWARHRISASHWENTIEPELLAVLLEPGGRGTFRKMAWLVAGALALTTISLSGPAWERLPQPVEQKNDALAIVLDLSLSMFGRDVEPSRLIRARQKITDVLRQRQEGFTALVVYAGDSHIVAPLTDDVHTIENLLSSLSPEMMPVLGSNLASALDITETLFANAKIPQGRILVVTDAIDNPGDATDYCSALFPLSVLGVGTPEGTTIPLDFVNQPGQILRTKTSQPVIARLDESTLREVASRCHGHYARLALGDQDISTLLATPLPQDDDTVEVEREFDTWSDKGYLALIVLLPLALFGFRRGLLAVLVLAVLPPPAQASWWDDLWRRPDQQAYSTLEQGEPGQAAMLFEDPAWQAVAHYRAADYPSAVAGFTRTEDPEGYYNLGNALAQNGEYQAAIAAYDRTLSQVPGHQDALFNRDLVQRLMEEQQSEQQDSDSEGEDGANPQDSSQPNDSGEQQPSDDQQQGQQPQEPEAESEQTESEQDAEQGEAEQGDSNRDERQDALEQWLRRVPDDPGGLLRRKFQYETNQRLRRGDYRNKETEKIW